MKKTVAATMLCMAVSTPALAQEADTSNARDGVRIELRATYETPTVSSLVEDDDVYKLGSSFAFGGELGFDLALGDSVVMGPYGQYEVSTVESCDGGFCVSTTGYFEAGLHIGYATSDAGQVYGKLGYGRLGFETEGLGLDTTENGSGVAFALGYEHGFGENIYGRIEGGYADVGEVYGINFQRRHFGVAVGARF
ncbi:outer membrane beta-barrel protein [Alteraurantiacibacter aquimixticola]|uniref:Porin family protein n=1 Tax=Alteraurantiacibacter aquimixticola TaxID=2489173 RepID=A0A4T3EXJ9_9SPHN|nr:outer membrane beta-barrel protein [Alteraurantiacibacter aquimixticola]TIX49253.1 porin family protein [Alteraurantiacibacter aquimixticola]